jgi:hypothetical protein
VTQDVCSNCHGMIGELAEGRDPEELCDTCYDDMQATRTTPAASQHSELADGLAEFVQDTDWELAGYVRENADGIIEALRQPQSDWMRGWMLIAEHAPPWACHVLGASFDEAVGEWVMAVVASPPSQPFTHWKFLDSPALTQENPGVLEEAAQMARERKAKRENPDA